jgi:hypothetical protein
MVEPRRTHPSAELWEKISESLGSSWARYAGKEPAMFGPRYAAR